MVAVDAVFRKYKSTPAITEFVSLAERGHSLCIDYGWREVAGTLATGFAQKIFNADDQGAMLISK